MAMNGKQLRKERLSRKIEQSELAKAIGVKSYTVSRWERGDNKILKKHWDNIDRFFRDKPIVKAKRECEQCGKDISNMSSKAIYCCKKCSDTSCDRKKHMAWEDYVEEKRLIGARQRLATSLADYIKRRETIRTVECAYCKAEFKTFDKLKNYCSSEHRTEHKKQLEWEAMPAKECVVCGNKFKNFQPNAITCSKKCSKKHSNRTNRKNRYNNNTIVVDKDITLEKLYQRDKGVCHICNGKCNPLDYDKSSGYFVVGKAYPSIDHVQPRSKGGVHSWDNVKLAHHYCNTIKNNNENKEEVINKINEIKTTVFIT